MTALYKLILGFYYMPIFLNIQYNFANFLSLLGYDLKIACAQFRFIVDGENNEKHALQIYQNTCVPGYSKYDMQSLVLGRRRRRWSNIKSTLCESLSFDRHTSSPRS